MARLGFLSQFGTSRGPRGLNAAAQFMRLRSGRKQADIAEANWRNLDRVRLDRLRGDDELYSMAHSHGAYAFVSQRLHPGYERGWVMIGIMLWVATEWFREFSDRS